MADFDVFNGDADGIISLLQLRMAEPREAALITGRKRDIKLLSRVDASKDDRVTVLDISMRSNADDLARILEAGADVFYVDHHNAGDIPKYDKLQAIINTSPEICTALLVDRYLDGAYRAWAVAAAYGDGFPKVAARAANGHDLPLEALKELGTLVNYNGYGASLEDLHIHPAELYEALYGYDTPMDFLAQKPAVFEMLQAGYKADYHSAAQGRILHESDKGFVTELADSVASRRISGVYGNDLAQAKPARAHAILTRHQGGYVVSVRAPITNRTGADTLCLQFETGGGRAAAAGINALPADEVDSFITAFKAQFEA